jgi:ubiquinone/menaquinone biosynthesis C-methylase UbiE
MANHSKAYFDEIGSGWDRMQESFFSERVRDRAFDVAAIEPGRTAVDVGAGTGFVSGALVDRGLRVVAVDQSRPMLDGLRAKLPSADGLDCRVGDAERLPVEDASADHVFANMCLHHVERPADAIREMVRVLRHDRWMGFDLAEVRGWLADAGLEDATVERIGEECCATSCDGERASIGIFVASGRKPGGRTTA